MLERLRVLRRFASDLAALAPDSLSAAKLWLVTVLLPLKRRLWLDRARWTVRVAVGGAVYKLSLRDRSEFEVMHEVLVRREYEIALEEAPDVILDLGAHVGFSVLFFRSLFPRARLVALEADPATFELLDCNVGQLPGVDVINAAVGHERGLRWLVRGDLSWGSRLSSEPSPGALRVQTRTLDDVLDAVGVDGLRCLVKLDVEGAEWEVLSSVEDLTRIDVVVGELHPGLIPVSPDDFFRLLSDFSVEKPKSPDMHGVFQAVRRSPLAARAGA